MKIEFEIDLTEEQEVQLEELLLERQVAGGVDGLLRGLLGDLLHTKDTGGSDERMYAEQWLERRWYPWMARGDWMDLEYGDQLRRSKSEWKADMEGEDTEGWTPEDFRDELREWIMCDFPKIPEEYIEAWLDQFGEVTG